MKNFLYILFCIIYFYGVGSAQKIDRNIDEVKTVLCKRWKFDHAVDNGTLSETSHMRNVDFIFYKNYEYGTIIQGVEKKGTWCFNEDTNNIELTTAEGDTSIRVNLLKENKIILFSSKSIRREKGKLPNNYTQLSPK